MNFNSNTRRKSLKKDPEILRNTHSRFSLIKISHIDSPLIPINEILPNKQRKKSSKIENLLSKIQSIPKDLKEVSPDINRLKRRLSSDIKSILSNDFDSINQQKEVLNYYRSCIKSNLYTISLSGRKFRQAQLKKHISSLHIRWPQVLK